MPAGVTPAGAAGVTCPSPHRSLGAPRQAGVPLTDTPGWRQPCYRPHLRLHGASFPLRSWSPDAHTATAPLLRGLGAGLRPTVGTCPSGLPPGPGCHGLRLPTLPHTPQDWIPSGMSSLIPQPGLAHDSGRHVLLYWNKTVWTGPPRDRPGHAGNTHGAEFPPRASALHPETRLTSSKLCTTSLREHGARKPSCRVMRPVDAGLDQTEAEGPERSLSHRGLGSVLGSLTGEPVPSLSRRKGESLRSASAPTTALVSAQGRAASGKPRTRPGPPRSEPLVLPGGVRHGC